MRLDETWGDTMRCGEMRHDEKGPNQMRWDEKRWFAGLSRWDDDMIQDVWDEVLWEEPWRTDPRREEQNLNNMRLHQMRWNNRIWFEMRRDEIKRDEGMRGYEMWRNRTASDARWEASWNQYHINGRPGVPACLSSQPSITAIYNSRNPHAWHCANISWIWIQNK